MFLSATWYSGHAILGGISGEALDINEIKTTTTLSVPMKYAT